MFLRKFPFCDSTVFSIVLFLFYTMFWGVLHVLYFQRRVLRRPDVAMEECAGIFRMDSSVPVLQDLQVPPAGRVSNIYRPHLQAEYMYWMLAIRSLGCLSTVWVCCAPNSHHIQRHKWRWHHKIPCFNFFCRYRWLQSQQMPVRRDVYRQSEWFQL